MKGMIKLFLSQNCRLCTTARERLKGLDYTAYDIGTVDGLAEASYYGVLSTPTMIEVDSQGEEVQRFVGKEIGER